MNEAPLNDGEFAASVMAVPPLARRADYSLDPAQNRALIRHIEAGGVRTLLYGGNANLYHVAVSEYRDLLDLLADAAGPATRVIPAIGPDYGKMLDQARILAQSRYRTAMVLPLGGFTTSDGVEAGLTRIADTAGMPLTLYLKSEDYLALDALTRLVERGTLSAIKYAIARAEPARDPYLRRLLDCVPAAKVVSGMGERPALVHLREFGLAAWTTGSGCIAPRMAMALLRAVQRERGGWSGRDDGGDGHDGHRSDAGSVGVDGHRGSVGDGGGKGRYRSENDHDHDHDHDRDHNPDHNLTRRLYDAFLPLETLREQISLIRVLHDAVAFAGLAETGPLLPLLSSTPAEHHAKIAQAAHTLLALEREFAHTHPNLSDTQTSA
ncbi:dihydrodipicolinate synthase family protein [Burkholderia sp. SRS-W-2-2016]|uniref:dihydrodipicolinate synthase family protein n=1 Tax=Burkholderia sp. SRS-W-2-2016 TaxID=1926878 RepID=UPI000A720BD1|nr:dihydrodipicolinate synthase family protein [Burkholderia sp. SRS-W-2-2016]